MRLEGIRRTATVLLVGALLSTLVPNTAASHDTTSPALNATTDTGYPSIQAAIDAASAGDVIVVRPGTHEGPITIHKSVELCRTTEGGSVCSTGASHDTVITSTGASTVRITASDVTLRGFTIRGAGEVVAAEGTSTTPLSLVSVRENRVEVLPGADARHGLVFRHVTGPVAMGNSILGNDWPGSHGIQLRNVDAPTATSNTITGANLAVYASAATGGVIGDNDVLAPPLSSTGGPTGGVSVFLSDGTRIANNRVRDAQVGVVVGSSTNVEIDRLSVVAAQTGVDVRQTVAPAPTGLVVKESDLSGALTRLAISSDVAGVHVDARRNHWGAYSRDAIASGIADAGSGNTVDFSCYYDLDGATTVCPPTAAFTFAPAAPSWSAPIAFQDASTSGGRALESWAWTFGSVGTSDAQNPSFQLPAGTHAVSLTVTDVEGWSGSTTQTVTVTGDPVLAPIGSKSIDLLKASKLEFTVSAVDPEGDVLTFSASNLPAGSAFDPSNRTFWWYPTQADLGTYSGVRFEVTDGTYVDAEEITILVHENVQAKIDLVSGNTQPVDTSPSVAVNVTFTAKNLGNVDDALTFSLAYPAGWAASVTPASVVLAPGASAAVTVQVTPATPRLAGHVYVTATSANGAAPDKAYALVRTPVLVAVDLAESVYFPATPVEGAVAAAFLDGSPAANHRVEVVEVQDANGVRVQTLPRTRGLVTGADGTASFSLPVSLAGANAPGGHVVLARSLDTVNPGSVDQDGYVVRATGVRPTEGDTRSLVAEGVAAAAGPSDSGAWGFEAEGAFESFEMGFTERVAIQAFGTVRLEIDGVVREIPVNVEGAGVVVEDGEVAHERWDLRFTGVASDGTAFHAELRLVTGSGSLAFTGTGTAEVPSPDGPARHAIVLAGTADF